MNCAYIGLGSNLGDRAGAMYAAIAHLAHRIGPIIALSSLYETEPWGVVEQPHFLNAVCLVKTSLAPEPLLETLKAIEAVLGRKPAPRYGPRAIDLDILLLGDLRYDTADLTIPHAGMLQRASVLVPLAEIAKELRHPVTERTIGEHLASLGRVLSIAPYPPGLGVGSSDEDAERSSPVKAR